jgi:hypothetical protein
MPRIMVSLLPGGLLVVQNQMHLYPSGHPKARGFIKPLVLPTLKIPLRAFRLYKTFGFKHS